MAVWLSIYGAITTWLHSIVSETPGLDVPHGPLLALAVLGAPFVAWLVSRHIAPQGPRPAADRGTGSGGAPSRTSPPLAVSPTAMLGIAAAVPILLIGTLRATGATLVYPRHMLMALPGLLIWLGMLLDQLPWPRVSIALSGALMALFVVCLVAYEIAGWRIADWRAAAQYVAAHASSGDLVLVAPAYEALPFQYYYPWAKSVVPVPAPARVDTADDSKTVIRDTTQLAAVFGPEQTRGAFWLVVSERPTVANFGRPVLEQFLERHYRVLTDTTVLNVSMRRLEAR
jgi:hypothetical protein